MTGNNCENSMKTETVYYERADGKIARIVLPVEAEDDVWTAIGRAYPTAWEVAAEDGLVPEYVHVDAWDATFEPGDDEELAAWMAWAPAPYAVVDVKGQDEAIWVTPCRTEEEAVCEARGQWSRLTPGERGRRHIVAVETLGRPAEELAGEILWDSDFVGLIPEQDWDAVWEEADLLQWDVGDYSRQMVQDGVWNGRHIRIVYELPEDFDEICTHENQDEVLRDAVVAIEWREYE